MNDVGTQAAVYQLKGPGIELTYRRGEGTLDLHFEDETSLGGDGLHVDETAEAGIGLHVTATLLGINRAGRQVMFTALLPEVRLSEGEGDSQEITGVAVVVDVNTVSTVLHSYEEPRRLEGTASRAG